VRQHQFIIALGGTLSLVFCLGAAAQDAGPVQDIGPQVGYYGAGHDIWHQDFYAKLRRNDGGGSCCNLMDCRPTQSRKVSGSYEVKVDNEWIPVPEDRINNVIAPDGGAHVCAPEQIGHHKGELFCVILPPEG
jgi:hypothetical protein